MLLSFNSGAFKHGISRKEIEEVLADYQTEEFEIESSRQGNYRVMYVGYTASDKVLEVGIECIDSLDQIFLHVFHANRASLQYRSLFKEAKRK